MARPSSQPYLLWPRCIFVFSLLIGVEAFSLVPIHAESWVSHGPGGGDIHAFAIDPVTPTTMYAGNLADVYKSVDGGASWTPSISGLTTARGLAYSPWVVSTLAVDPHTPQNVYAGTGFDGIFKSEDGGQNWQVVADSRYPHIFSMVVDPAGTVYAGYFWGVLKSEDGGTSWREIDNGLTTAPRIYALVIDPTTPSRLYAANAGFGVFKSEDGGESWSAVNNGLAVNSWAYALAIDPTTPDTLYAATSYGPPGGCGGDPGLFKSDNGGASWREINVGLTSKGFSALAVDPVTPGNVYAAMPCAQGLFKSSDGGGTWSQSNNGLTADSVNVLAITPASVLFAGTDFAGAFTSSDQATTWRAANTGLAVATIRAVASDQAVPGRIYAGTESGVTPSTDAAASWQRNIFPPRSDARVYAVALDPANHDSTMPSTLYIGTNRGMFRSEDGGSSGTAINSNNVFAIAIDPLQTATLYAGTNVGIFKSDDRGDHWRSVDVGLTTSTVFALAVDPGVPSTIYAGTDMGVFKSDDGGDNWRAIDNGLSVAQVNAVTIDPAMPRTLYAGTDGGVFKSNDGGGSWRAVDNGLTTMKVNAIAIDAALLPGTMYIGTDAGVFKSEDGAASWHVVNDGLTVLTVTAIAIDPSSTVYVGTFGGGVFYNQF